MLKKFHIQHWLAAPVEPSVLESTWLTASTKAFPILRKVSGDRSQNVMNRTYAGSCTWLNGVFWVERVKTDQRRTVIRNLGDVGRSKVESVTVPVEDDFLFPLLRGRDVHVWHAEPSAMILVPHRTDDFSEPVSVADLKRRNPLTFEFFKRFEKPLKARSGYKQLYKRRPEFYVVGNTGNYTLSPYKVVFKDLAEMFQCAVIGPSQFGGLPSRPVVPDHTLLFISCQTEDQAHFQAGILNSLPARSALYCASVGVQTQRYFPTDVSRIRLPEFDAKNETHREIVRLSRACHEGSVRRNASRSPNDAEMKLAAVVSTMWSISRKELKDIIDFYREIQNLRSRGSASDDDEAE